MIGWARPFPAIEDVFETVTDDIRELYLPALSIDASIVNPAFGGPLHFVMPVEPFDGALDEFSSDTYRNHYCRNNLIAFRRTKSGRYEPLAHPMLFAINCARKNRGIFLREPRSNAQNTLREAQAFYADVHASFAEKRAEFTASGDTTNVWNESDNWLSQIGGEAPPLALDSFRDQTPLSLGGRPFFFVGKLNEFAFRRHYSDGFYVFFEPVEEIVWCSLIFQ